jgi:transcription factor SFP1
VRQYDSIMMTGTSPFTFQSPSFHSSSYLPKLEAEFCRDFSCCGIPLPSLHDLLLHYEEHHAQQMPVSNENENQDNHHNGRGGAHDVNRQQSRHPQQQNAGITSPIGGIGGIQYEMMRQQQMQRQRQQQQEEERGTNHQDDQPGDEIAGDMEMDDDMTPPPNMAAPLTSPQAHLGQQHFSHPTTPSTMNLPSYHSTPNLATAQLPHLAKPPSHFSPESSVPGTPLATDNLEFGFPQNLAGFPNQQFNSNLQYGTGIETSGDLSLNLCIDEPAKRLFSPGGQTLNVYGQAQMQQYMSNGSSDLSKKLGESGSSQVPTMQAALMQVEDKPFKCPVIGCEKAYKNQNGLKYHKAVSAPRG